MKNLAILIADDGPVVRHLLVRRLFKEKYGVQAAGLQDRLDKVEFLTTPSIVVRHLLPLPWRNRLFFPPQPPL
jgi:hypothetical protein